ncbi:MAG: LysR family transcriptional regulator [Bacteroidota bacterium]
MLSYRWKVFRSVAKNLSFTKAAEEMFITQPAITRHIQQLEEELGISCFHRSRKGLSLTQAGKLVLTYSDRVWKIYQTFEKEMDSLMEKISQNFRIGACTTLGQYFIPSLVSQFKKQYTSLHISLIHGNSENIQAEVLKGNLDVGIIGETTQTGELRYENFLTEDVIPVTRSGSKYENLFIDLKRDASQIPFIMRKSGSGTRKLIENYCKRLQLPWEKLNIIIELDSHEAAKSFLLTEDSIGFFPHFAVAKELQFGLLSQVSGKNLSIKRSYQLVYPQGPINPGLIGKFLDFFHNRSL